jgi:hypothetical protein
MKSNKRPGGIIHTYQRFDPAHFPSPTTPPPDMVSPAFDHLLMYGNTRRLTEEELARAIQLDPSQIRGLGPGLDVLQAILRERKRKILETYETDHVVEEAGRRYQEQAKGARPPAKLGKRYQEAVRDEQLRDLENLWYTAGGEQSEFGKQLLQVVARLGDKYQVDELAAKYAFSGRTPMTIAEALAIKIGRAHV